MRKILEHIDEKTRDYEGLPLFAFLRDGSIDAKERLGFVPCLAHFVMTFSDLYGLILRDEPPRDRFQELVNAHTYEDGGHWKWFLADLVALGHDKPERVSDTLRSVWGDETIRSRMLAFEMCRLGHRKSSIHRLALVHCIEAAGKVSLAAASPVGREVGDRLGKPLVYFGPHHFETESDHTLEEVEVRKMLDSVRLDPATEAELMTLVDEAFAAFVGFSDELLRFAQARRKA